ncbi:hypothetical protein QN239_31575 [Mycolicibacterium sp. Y3]
MTRHITAEAPSYAPDGSRGYILTIAGAAKLSGWIRVGDDGHTVLATVDHAPWKPVGTVDAPAELTPNWVKDHADSIIRLV